MGDRPEPTLLGHKPGMCHYLLCVAPAPAVLVLAELSRRNDLVKHSVFAHGDFLENQTVFQWSIKYAKLRISSCWWQSWQTGGMDGSSPVANAPEGRRLSESPINTLTDHSEIRPGLPSWVLLRILTKLEAAYSPPDNGGRGDCMGV